jgi:hypothetical protein
MIELTLEQRQLVLQQEKASTRAIDPDTDTTYVLVPEVTYVQMQALLAQQVSGQFSQDIYASAMELFGWEGWDVPEMDIYNDLDPRKQ